MKMSTRPDTRAGSSTLPSRGLQRGHRRRLIARDQPAAEQSNASALQYHFGDRTGLLRAIIEKHRADTEARRHALLDHYESSGSSDLRTLASALLLPLAAKLDDPDGGREYLRINAEIQPPRLRRGGRALATEPTQQHSSLAQPPRPDDAGRGEDAPALTVSRDAVRVRGTGATCRGPSSAGRPVVRQPPHRPGDRAARSRPRRPKPAS